MSVLCGAMFAALLAIPVAVSLSVLVPSSPAVAQPSGGTISYSLGSINYAFHTFTQSGTFTVPAGASFNVDYGLVGGGGGGGNYVAGGPVYGAAGGGGGGGALSGVTSTPLTAGSYNVVVGTGGAGGVNGSNSTWNGVTALGGGRGASVNVSTAADPAGAPVTGVVGSGGGGRCGLGANNGGKNTSGQGQLGGTGATSCTAVPLGLGASNAGGGGGGSSNSGTGATTPDTAGGKGGPGKPLFATATAFGAGGGGGASQSGTNDQPGAGGNGNAAGNAHIVIGGKGAGRGTTSADLPGEGVDGYFNIAATNNNIGGGGGGGGGGNFAHPAGAAGGDGVVILRYRIGFVSYNANTGSGTVPTDSPYIASGESTTVAVPSALSKTGYHFTEWNTLATPSPPVTPGVIYHPADTYTAPASPTKVTLFAQWAANHYQVAFDANDADGGTAIGPQAFTYDTAQNLTANQWTRTGYTFAGWNTEKLGTGTAYADQASVSNLTSVDGDTVQLYAQWTPNDYRVAFNANGGGGTPMADQDFVYDVEENLTVTDWVRTGYSFQGWTEAPGGTGTLYPNGAAVMNLTDVRDETVPLYAQWRANDYKVAFNGNGGGGTPMADQDFVYDVEENLTVTDWTRTGYSFKGWTEDSGGTGTLYPNGAAVKNLTDVADKTVQLYAQWTPNDYTVAYDAHGGVGTMANQDFVYDVAENLNRNTFTRTGYLFDGWRADDQAGTVYADRQQVSNLTAVDNGVVTMSALWEPINFYVRFDANGGAGAMAVQPFSFDDPQDLTANTLTRTGYHFTGWNTAADGSGTSYADRQNVNNLTDVDQATVVLYAQWSAHHYTVSFGGNGGARTMPGQAFVYGTPQALAANTFTRTGYSFAGWNTAANGSGAAYADQQVVSNLTSVDGATVPLYAQWEALPDTSGGEGKPPTLPNTGGPVLWLPILALLLLGCGLVALIASRRRR